MQQPSNGRQSIIAAYLSANSHPNFPSLLSLALVSHWRAVYGVQGSALTSGMEVGSAVDQVFCRGTLCQGAAIERSSRAYIAIYTSKVTLATEESPDCYTCCSAILIGETRTESRSHRRRSHTTAPIARRRLCGWKRGGRSGEACIVPWCTQARPISCNRVSFCSLQARTSKF